MAPPQQIKDRGIPTPQNPSESSPLIKAQSHHPPSPILPRNNPPTTHDATAKPPWKKHKSHPTPPTSNWALLWPRPPSWRCPLDASYLSGYAGCEYVEAPAVFDPEIEGLPDWMGPKEKEERLWSGIERVVVVPAGERRRVERRGSGEREDGEGREMTRAVYQVRYLPPLLPGRHILIETSTVEASPTATMEVARPTSAEDSHVAKDYKTANIMGTAFPVCTVVIFGLFCCFVLGRKLKKNRREKTRKAEAARRRLEMEARESRYQLREMNVEEGRAQRKDETNMQEETWEDLSLR